MPSISAKNTIPTTTVSPPCPVFGVCGGCRYQDIPYEDELRLKFNKLKETLASIPADAQGIWNGIIASENPYHYRSHIDLTYLKSRDGKRLWGFQSEGRFNIVPVETCPIAREEITEAMPSIKSDIDASFPEGYRLANIVIKSGHDGRVVWGGIGKGSLKQEPKDYLWTEIGTRRIHFALNTFFQTNLSILPKVWELLKSLRVWNTDEVFYDLYSGVGLFGILMADRVRQVIMVEDNPYSVKAAEYNTAYLGLKNITIHRDRLETWLDRPDTSDAGFSRVGMIDPPRAGLSAPVRDKLVSDTRWKELFYLSCSPESLARDLEALVKGGWTVHKVTGLDFFPRTRHLETLVYLKRGLS